MIPKTINGMVMLSDRMVPINPTVKRPIAGL
jgi:hypothetical protein